MDVLLTGAFGRVGTAVIDGLAGREAYEFTYFDRETSPEYASIEGDVTDYDAVRSAVDGVDAVIPLAGSPLPARPRSGHRRRRPRRAV